MVDASVFIRFERRGVPIDLSPWEPSEGVFISVVTVSELLTDNVEEFSRVAGLPVIPFGP